MAKHPELIDQFLHVPGYSQANDPGAIGAGKLWTDTSLGPGAWVLKQRNAANNGWEALSGGGGGGVTVFTSLTDTPSAYVGQGGKVVAVNVGETALEFIAAGGVSDFIGLSDTPVGYPVITPGQPVSLKVNATSDGLEFEDGYNLVFPIPYGGTVSAVDQHGATQLVAEVTPDDELKIGNIGIPLRLYSGNLEQRPKVVDPFGIVTEVALLSDALGLYYIGGNNLTQLERQWNPVVFGQLNYQLSASRIAVSGLVIATGDGVQSSFDDQGNGHFFASNPGSITITVLLTDAETATITDDRNGNLEDTVNDVVGTVNYGNGEWTLVFNGAVPANAEDLVADFNQYSGSPTIRVTAYDMLRGVQGGFPPFQYGISKSGPPASFEIDARDAYVEFTCLDLGIQFVEVWVQDVYGNQTFIQSAVNIQDNFVICP